MNDKEIRDIIQQEKHNVPATYSQFLDQTLANLPKKKKKKKTPFIMSAVAALVLLTVTTAVSETVADTFKRIPLIGPIFEAIGDSGLNQASKLGLTSPVNETISSDTITLTITDVLYDGTRLSIAYIKENSEKFEPGYMNHFVEDMNISIDGKRLGTLGMGIRAEQLDDHTLAGVADFSIEEPLNEQFTFTLTIKELDGQKGNWKITIPVQKIQDGTTILLQDQKKYDDKNWKLTKATLTPATTKIDYETIMARDSIQHSDEWDLSFQLFDDKGMQLRPFSAQASGSPLNKEEWIEKSSAVFAPVASPSNHLLFQAIMRPIKEEPGKQIKAPLQGEFPIEMSQGEVGKLKLINMIYKENETLVYYNVEGKDPYRQATLWFIDNDGNTYRSHDVPEKISNEAYEFLVKFPKLPSKEQLTAVTVEVIPPKIIEELRFKIPIYQD